MWIFLSYVKTSQAHSVVTQGVRERKKKLIFPTIDSRKLLSSTADSFEKMCDSMHGSCAKSKNLKACMEKTAICCGVFLWLYLALYFYPRSESITCPTGLVHHNYWRETLDKKHHQFGDFISMSVASNHGYLQNNSMWGKNNRSWWFSLVSQSCKLIRLSLCNLLQPHMTSGSPAICIII